MKYSIRYIYYNKLCFDCEYSRVYRFTIQHCQVISPACLLFTWAPVPSPIYCLLPIFFVKLVIPFCLNISRCVHLFTGIEDDFEPFRCKGWLCNFNCIYGNLLKQHSKIWFLQNHALSAHCIRSGIMVVSKCTFNVAVLLYFNAFSPVVFVYKGRKMFPCHLLCIYSDLLAKISI